MTVGTRRKAGDVAGSIANNGRRVIGIDGRLYSASHLAFLYVTGDWPSGIIGRINGKPDDLRWDNLVPNRKRIPQARRQRGRQRRPVWRANNNNKSGFRGVSYNTCSKRFQAAIYIDGHQVHLGYFDSPEQAHDAYCDAVVALEFDERARASL